MDFSHERRSLHRISSMLMGRRSTVGQVLMALAMADRNYAQAKTRRSQKNTRTDGLIQSLSKDYFSLRCQSSMTSKRPEANKKLKLSSYVASTNAKGHWVSCITACKPSRIDSNLSIRSRLEATVHSVAVKPAAQPQCRGLSIWRLVPRIQ